MNILDENIIDDQYQLLRRWRISVRQIGVDVGRGGMQDEEIITFLHGLNRPTFFTRDNDFCKSTLCHPKYCLVYLAIKKKEVAIFVRRLLRHPEFNTKAKRMGTVIWVSHVGLSVWYLHAEKEVRLSWSK